MDKIDVILKQQSKYSTKNVPNFINIKFAYFYKNRLDFSSQFSIGVKKLIPSSVCFKFFNEQIRDYLSKQKGKFILKKSDKP